MDRRRGRFSLFKFDAQPKLRACDHPGCSESGDYRAPKSRSEPGQYYWFCLTHVRAYNSGWNYFAGLSDAEVERILRHDTVWERPTRPLGSWHVHERRLRDRLAREFGGRDNGNGEDERMGGGAVCAHNEEDKALAVLNLKRPVDPATVKARYKSLVKRHHPDANGGSREAEEMLKVINRAYAVLKASFAT